MTDKVKQVGARDVQRGLAAILKDVDDGWRVEITRDGQVLAVIVRPEPIGAEIQAEPPAVPWERGPSAGIPGSPRALDGRQHIRLFPCPSGRPYRLSEDERMWLEDWPPLDLRVVDRVLSAAFPQRARSYPR